MQVNLQRFFEVNTVSDMARIFRVPVLFSLMAGKLYMMIECGCQVSELNNWVSHAIRTPWYWRTSADGIRFVAGPYSSLWYWLNEPARLGYWGWMSYLWLVDLGISLLAFYSRSWKFLVPYMMSSIYFYNIDPIDLWPFWFSIVPLLWQHRYAILGPLVALAVKLPLDAPGYVWTFIFNNPYGIHEPGGWLRYGQIGAWFLVSVGFYAKRHRGKVTPKGLDND